MRVLAAVACIACASPAATAKPPEPPPAPAPPRPEEEARAALFAFSDSVSGGRWTEAYGMLSARWRARMTPERLAADFREAGPIGTRALSRVEALLALGAVPQVRGRAATLPVGEGRAAVLVLEDGRWRVDALE